MMKKYRNIICSTFRFILCLLLYIYTKKYYFNYNHGHLISKRVLMSYYFNIILSLIYFFFFFIYIYIYFTNTSLNQRHHMMSLFCYYFHKIIFLVIHMRFITILHKSFKTSLVFYHGI